MRKFLIAAVMVASLYTDVSAREPLRESIQDEITRINRTRDSSRESLQIELADAMARVQLYVRTGDGSAIENAGSHSVSSSGCTTSVLTYTRELIRGNEVFDPTSTAQSIDWTRVKDVVPVESDGIPPNAFVQIVYDDASTQNFNTGSETLALEVAHAMRSLQGKCRPGTPPAFARTSDHSTTVSMAMPAFVVAPWTYIAEVGDCRASIVANATDGEGRATELRKTPQGIKALFEAQSAASHLVPQTRHDTKFVTVTVGQFGSTKGVTIAKNTQVDVHYIHDQLTYYELHDQSLLSNLGDNSSINLIEFQSDGTPLLVAFPVEGLSEARARVENCKE